MIAFQNKIFTRKKFSPDRCKKGTGFKILKKLVYEIGSMHTLKLFSATFKWIIIK